MGPNYERLWKRTEKWSLGESHLVGDRGGAGQGGHRPQVAMAVLAPRCAVTAASMRWTSPTWRQHCGQRSLVDRPMRRPRKRLPDFERWNWNPNTMMWTSPRR